MNDVWQSPNPQRAADPLRGWEPGTTQPPGAQPQVQPGQWTAGPYGGPVPDVTGGPGAGYASGWPAAGHGTGLPVAGYAGPPTASLHRRPGPLTLGRAIAVISGAAAGGIGVGLLLYVATLSKVLSLFSGDAPGLMPSRNGTGDLFPVVLFCLGVLALGVALVWGAMSAYTGASTTPAVVAFALVATLLVYGAGTLRAILLVLLVLPAVGLVAMLAPSSKTFCRFPAGTTVWPSAAA